MKSRISFLLLLLLSIFTLSPIQAQEEGSYIRLESVSQKGLYLNIEHGAPELSKVGPGFLSARWELIRLNQDSQGPTWALKSKWTGQYLSSVNRELVMSDLQMNAQGQGPSVWRLNRRIADATSILQFQNVGDFSILSLDQETAFTEELPPVAPVAQAPTIYYRLVSLRDLNARINIEHGAPEVGEAADGFHSAMWEMEEQNLGRGRSVAFKNRWTGEYLSANGTSVTMGKTGFDKTGFGPGVWQVTTDVNDPNVHYIQNSVTRTNLVIAKQKSPGVFDLRLGASGSNSAQWGFDRIDD